ncbi:MAG: amidohydrolase family protein, partial [Terriglobia bacterium]
MTTIRLVGLLLMLSEFWLSGLLGAQDVVTVPVEIAAYPDVILHSGKVVTMDDASFGLNTPVGTIAEAVAIRDGKIFAVGTNDRILRLAGPRTDRIDVRGRMVMPGIIDAHSHMHNGEVTYWLTQNPEAVQAVAARYSVAGRADAELEQGTTLVLQEHVRSTAPGRWAFVAVGAGGGTGLGAGVAFLQSRKYTKQMVDRIAPSHPVMLFAHPSYVMNTAAVKAMEKLYGSPLTAEAVDEFGIAHNTA